VQSCCLGTLFPGRDEHDKLCLGPWSKSKFWIVKSIFITWESGMEPPARRKGDRSGTLTSSPPLTWTWEAWDLRGDVDQLACGQEEPRGTGFTWVAMVTVVIDLTTAAHSCLCASAPPDESSPARTPLASLRFWTFVRIFGIKKKCHRHIDTTVHAPQCEARHRQTTHTQQTHSVAEPSRPGFLERKSKCHFSETSRPFIRDLFKHAPFGQNRLYWD